VTEEKRYSIGELEHKTGIKRRTIHHYIAQGLLPPAVGSGPSAYYLQEHYLRLRLISLLGNVVRTDKIKRALDLWSEDEMERMVDLAEGRRMRDLDALRRWLGRSWESGEESSDVRYQDAAALGVSEQEMENEHDPFGKRQVSPGRSERVASDPAPPEEVTSGRIRERPAGYMPEQLVMGSLQQLGAPVAGKAKRRSFFSTWHRHRVVPDVEIHFRRNDDPLFERRLGELIAVANRLFAGLRDREEEANNEPTPEGKEKENDKT
jgi:DNA-binding transcriptional MerR regulator